MRRQTDYKWHQRFKSKEHKLSPSLCFLILKQNGSLLGTKTGKCLGQELCSSGYEGRLMFWRWWVQIPALHTEWTIFTLICCKNCIDDYLKKNENKRNRGRERPSKKRLTRPASCTRQARAGRRRRRRLTWWGRYTPGQGDQSSKKTPHGAL